MNVLLFTFIEHIYLTTPFEEHTVSQQMLSFVDHACKNDLYLQLQKYIIIISKKSKSR